MIKRLRDWWITHFGGSCEVCKQCRSGPLKYTEILVGPSMFLIPCTVVKCSRCGYEWEEY
jgi:hypothetical protein